VPSLYTIDAGAPFVDALAAGILARHGADPLLLNRVTVLMPTRRACRALHGAFLRAAAGRALLLPAIRPLGEMDDDDEAALLAVDPGGAASLPAAAPPLLRQMLLTRLLRRRLAVDGVGGDLGTAARLAGALAALIDSVTLNDLSFDGLDTLVPADYAAHWQLTLRFLAIVRESWPKILAERGLIDPAERRVRALRALAARWRAQPPNDPVYAAGSTGSIPATAELIAVIAALPAGAVVLPGLDRDMDAAAWDAVAADAVHPQHGMAHLLTRLGVDRGAVETWPHPAARAPNAARVRLLADALGPASTTDAWHRRPAPPASAFAGWRRVDCAGPQDEAVTIALALRQALETPARTAALVTPDRALARRVATELKRWNLAVDDSAGLPLDRTPPGVFLRLTADLIASDAAPIAVLAALKHPLAMAGQPRGAFLKHARRLERRVLRGPRLANGFAGIVDAAGALEHDADLANWFAAIAAAAEPFTKALARPAVALKQVAAAHFRFAEWLAADAGGATALWRGEAGDALREFCGEVLESAAALDRIDGAEWPALLQALMAARVVRPAYGRHPRLFIWGPLEARLQSADLLVLGGLNEGAWPAESEEDPWLSRPMRRGFGLPALERMIGLSAHDFAQAAAAPAVIFTRATKVDGTPTVPSRWLARLDAMLAKDQRWEAARQTDYPAWRRALDAPAAVRPRDPPAPRPPLAARPRQLSVTEIETWVRDPYAIYARRILRLRPLDDIDADPGALERGQKIHEALDQFLRQWPGALPDDAAQQLTAIGERCFGAWLARPAVRGLWWPRFERLAEWFIGFERGRRAAGIAALATEIKGRTTLPGAGGDFTLTAKADRIDRLPGGALAILDYKTGAAPPYAEVASGLSPQLPLEAAMAIAGGFPGIGANPVGELAFVRLTGGELAGEYLAVEPSGRDKAPLDAAQLAAKSIAGLGKLIARYDDPATPYLSRPRPRWVKYGDYDHLARVKEWSVAFGEES
jgi:ATP-dependent helicase/nuclease subunit B